MSDRIRAFLALRLPAELSAAAATIQDDLRDRFPPRAIKWVGPELFHLTVRFFGDLDPRQIETATAVVRELDRNFPPVAVRIEGVSAFPSPARPQTLWVAVGDRETRLDQLVARLDQRLRETGFGPADKPWKSHLTIGRAHREARLKLDPGRTRGLTWPGDNFTIRTVALMQSELRPEGPRYTPLGTATAA
jgi:2'-5' RNA ligase